jgi:hypothetical protein
MPLVKGYDGDDNYYHIKFAISSANPDLQGDQMTEKALGEMVEQAKGINVDGSKLKGINIDDSHQKGLKAIIGPVTDAWLDETKMLWVDLRVRKEWTDTIKDLVDSGTHLGGSMQGKATKVLKKAEEGIRKIDGVRLFKAALTDIPAAWDTRGTAQAVTKDCPMCTQIFKSLDSDFTIDKEVKNVALNENESYEALSNKLRVLINDKYTIGDRSKFWVRRTWPNAVVAEAYDEDKNYVIPYSIDENGDIVLGEPKEADNQWIEKMAEFYDKMLKDVRGGKLTDIEIPEGVDLEKEDVNKLKSLGDKGKEFIKGLLGLEDKDPDPTGNSNQVGDPDGEDIKKTLEDMQKDIDGIKTENTELKKELETVKDENTELKKDMDGTIQSVAEKEHKNLVKTALDLTKKYDEETEIKNEKELLKSFETEFSKEEIEEDPDSCIKTYNRIMTKALQKIPDGSIPVTTDETLKKQADKDKQEADDLRKEIAEMGTAPE